MIDFGVVFYKIVKVLCFLKGPNGPFRILRRYSFQKTNRNEYLLMYLLTEIVLTLHDVAL